MSYEYTFKSIGKTLETFKTYLHDIHYSNKHSQNYHSIYDKLKVNEDESIDREYR